MPKITKYPNQYTDVSQGSAEELSWPELVELLREPEIVNNKGRARQIFYGQMRDGAQSKGDADVLELSCLVMDIDKMPLSDLPLIEKVIVDERWTAILHSTHSHRESTLHDPPEARVRVILPLSRPVLPEEMPLLWSNANLIFGGRADSTTRNPSKAYLVSSVPPGDDAKNSYIFREFKGESLDPDTVMTRFGLGVLAESEVDLFAVGTEPVSPAMIVNLLKQRPSKSDRPYIDAIKRGIERLSMAESGNRENTYFGVAGVFAKHFPRGNPDDICAALEYSIDYEHKQGGPSLKEFRDKLVRRQRDLLQRAALRRMESAKEQAKIAKIKATKEPYTPESLQPYFENCNNKINFEGLKHALVLVHRNNYYVFGEGKYYFATPTSLLATVREWLLYRAEELDFDYYYPREGEKPPTAKIPDHFVRDHGRVIHSVKYTHLGVSWYDANEQILWLSESKDCRRILPERCKPLENWILCMCGGSESLYEKWCQWLSQVPDTRKALAGLVLAGPTGIGKSAFAEGVSLLWGGAPGTMQNAMSTHNSELIHSPVVFADESLPEINGRVPTDKLRSLISSRYHEINPKNLPIAQLDSFVRVIVALQNMSKFDFGRGHTREDNVAIGRRFLFIEGEKAAASLFDYDLFVSQMGIAKHIMWLSQAMPRASERFGVEIDDVHYVIQADPVAMRVADWILDWLRGRNRPSLFARHTARPKTRPIIVNRNREVLVNAPAMRSKWEGSADPRVPDPERLIRAIRSLAINDNPVRPQFLTGPVRPSYYSLSLETLRRRLRSTEVYSLEEFDLLLDVCDDLPFKTASLRLTDEDRQRRLAALKDLGLDTDESP